MSCGLRQTWPAVAIGQGELLLQPAGKQATWIPTWVAILRPGAWWQNLILAEPDAGRFWGGVWLAQWFRMSLEGGGRGKVVSQQS